MNALVAFFLGQLTLALLIFAFIKFFIFGEPPPPSHTARRGSEPGILRSQASTQRLRHKQSSASALRPQPPITTASILAKTYYNVSGHQPESLDWFNVLVAQTIAQLRADAQHDGAILKSLTDVLNGSQRPDFLGEIKVTEISLGEEYPIFSNCRIIPVEEHDAVAGDGSGTRLQARLDVDLSDGITLGVETKLVLNYPKPVSAVLPVALAVSVVRFSGTLSLSFIPGVSPTSNTDTTSPLPTNLAFSFLPDYRLDLSVRSLVGSRSRLQDVPKIAQLVEARIHAWFDERCVEPRVQQIAIPSLWPRKKNTRGGDEGAGSDDGMLSVDESLDSRGTYDSRGHSERRERKERANSMNEVANDGSLDARMAAEGAKMRAAESRSEREERVRLHQREQEGVRRRPMHVAHGSTEDLRIPGRFI